MTERVEIGDAVLYHGDCLEILPTLEKVDAVVTDPPYFGREDLFPTGAVTAVLSALDAPSQIVFWPWYGDNPIKFDAVHIWHKAVPIHPRSITGNVAGHQYERIFSKGFGKKARVFRHAAIMPNFAACMDEFAEHPTQKPVSLLVELIGSLGGRSVLDPFMGSGTTGVACAQLGRKFIGIEIERRYFDIACERIEKAYAQGKLFDEPVTKPEQAALL